MKGENEKTVVSLLPGSRKQEIRRLLPLLLNAANVIHEEIPSVTFLLSCSNARNFELIESIAQHFTSANSKKLSMEIVTEKISEVIKASSLCISSSGTIVLEVANYHIPMVIFYRVSRFSYFIAKPHMNTPYICLINAIAGKIVVPEKLMYRDDYKWLAYQSTDLLLNEERREACIDGLREITSLVGSPGASAKAADEALGMI